MSWRGTIEPLSKHLSLPSPGPSGIGLESFVGSGLGVVDVDDVDDVVDVDVDVVVVQAKRTAFRLFRTLRISAAISSILSRDMGGGVGQVNRMVCLLVGSVVLVVVTVAASTEQPVSVEHSVRVLVEYLVSAAFVRISETCSVHR